MVITYNIWVKKKTVYFSIKNRYGQYKKDYTLPRSGAQNEHGRFSRFIGDRGYGKNGTASDLTLDYGLGTAFIFPYYGYGHFFGLIYYHFLIYDIGGGIKVSFLGHKQRLECGYLRGESGRYC